MSNEIKLQVPDDVILQHVRLAVAHALGTGDPKALIDRVVEMVMTKSSRHYGKTLWEDAIEKMIEEVAEQTFKQWVQANRPAIEKALTEAMRRKKNALVKALVDGVLGSAHKYRKVDVNFTVISD